MDNEFLNIDCMEYMRSLNNNSIDLVLTDIPYDGVNDNDDSGGLRKLNKGKADIITFDLANFLNEIYRITKGTAIIFCSNSQMSEIYNFFKHKKDFTTRQLIWEKTNPSPMNGELFYLSGIENAVYAKKRGGTFNGFCQNCVFRYPSGSSELHPTEKNHNLLKRLINDNSNIGDVVFDPCAGSGSTLLCANECGRKYIGCELDSEFYKKAKERLDAETAQTTIFDFL